MGRHAKEIPDWLRRQLSASGAQGFAVGLSGGIDSAVVARLCQIAAPGKVLGLIMPCHSAASDGEDARTAADHFGIPAVEIDLTPSYDHLVADMRSGLQYVAQGQIPAAALAEATGRETVALANLKPRLRMSTLYFVSNSLNYLVAGTGNRSELMIGSFTKHGDGGVDLLPLGTLLKKEVQGLARELGVPERILDKPSSAGLWPGQTDEQEMGFTYSDLERYVTEGPEAVSPALAMRIERLVRASEHKRSLAPVPDFD
jgi:NAD+ synthase